MRIIKHVLLPLLIVLIIIRLSLPHVVRVYAEHRLNSLPDYRARIADIQLNLWRGSYTILGLKLEKIDHKIPVPFFAADTIDLAISWRALFHGSLVADIDLYKPTINFVVDPHGKEEQVSIDDKWRNIAKSLFPLNFNRISVKEGMLHFRSFTSKPPFDLYLKDIDGSMDNLRNVDRSKDELPSKLKLTANTKGGAQAKLAMGYDPFAAKPTFKLNAEIVAMNIKEANNLLQHYTKITVSQGTFSLFVEVAAAKGKISGYAKPIFKNLKIMEPSKSANPIEYLYKGAVEVVTKILENSKKKTVATKVIIKGDIDDPDTSIWSILSYLLRNAFIQALLPKIDNTVEMKDVVEYPTRH